MGHPRLYSPAQYDSLPGLPFPAKKWTFPGKDHVGAYLEAYARHFKLPVVLETRVQKLERGGDQYVVTTDRGRYCCDNVAVATGTFARTPLLPAAKAGSLQAPTRSRSSGSARS